MKNRIGCGLTESHWGESEKGYPGVTNKSVMRGKSSGLEVKKDRLV